MYQDNANMSSNGTQWYSLPSYYTASGNQQNVRVQDPVPSYLASEASLSYQYQSVSPVNQYLAPETTSSRTIHQYGLTDPWLASHYRTLGVFFDEWLPDKQPCQNYLNSAKYDSQAAYSTKGRSPNDFERGICNSDLDLYAYTRGSRGHSQTCRIRKQNGSYCLSGPRIRRIAMRDRRTPYKKTTYDPLSGQSKRFCDTKYKSPLHRLYLTEAPMHFRCRMPQK